MIQNNFLRCTKQALLIGFLFIFGNFLFSQNQADLDTSYHNGFLSGDCSVVASAVQTDGKLLVGGNFTNYNGAIANGIARLNADGTLDTTFVPNNNSNWNYGAVYAIAVQPNGKILIGVKGGIWRMNIDGTPDTTFGSTGSGFASFATSTTSYVSSVGIQSDGKIVFGTASGYFADTATVKRLNSNGTMDTSFPTIDTNSWVKSIVIQPNDKIIVGGTFNSFTYSPIPPNYTDNHNGIIRLNADGTPDTSNILPDVGSVNSVSLQTDGKIIVIGNVGTTTPTQNILRINTNGSIDTSFTIGTGFNNEVKSIQLLANGKILAGGSFTSYNGVMVNRIALLNADGTLDTSFSTGAGFNNNVWNVNVQADGKLLAFGGYTQFNNQQSTRITRLQINGQLDATFATGSGMINRGTVTCSYKQADGKMIIGGEFYYFDNTSQYKLIRLNVDGTLDTSFVSPLNSESIPYTINQQADGKILVGGSFYINNQNYTLVRLNTDGTLDTTFTSAYDNLVNAILVLSDGKIIVGGNSEDGFSAVSRGIMKLNTNGSEDTSFIWGSGFNLYSQVRALKLTSDNKILAAGSFSSYNGQNSGGIIRLNMEGTQDNTFNNGNTGLTGTGRIYDLDIQSDGKIVAVGKFRTYNGTTANGIIRLLSNGAMDTSFVTGTGFRPQPTSQWSNNIYENIYSVKIQPDQKIIVGGDFIQYKGINQYGIICLNADGSKDTSFNSDTRFPFGSILRTVNIDSTNKIIAGGDFSSYNNVARTSLIRLHGLGVLATAEFKNEITSIVVYPNPTSDFVNIESKEKRTINTVQVFDMNGKLVKTVRPNSDKVQFSVDELPSGIYFVKVMTDKNSQTLKIIKK